MSNVDVNVILENLTELLTNTVNMTSVFYDLFINPEPMDVTLTQFDNEGELVTISVPNRAKDMQRARLGVGSPEGREAAYEGTMYVDESSEAVWVKAIGNGTTGWKVLLTQEGVYYYVGQYLIDNGYVNENDLATYLHNNNYTTENDVVNIIARSRSIIPMDVLPSSGTIQLTDGYTYRITPTDDVTFELPVVSDLTKLHRIFVQLNLTNADFEIDTGASYFFNKINPDFSKVGIYDIQYEYDNALNTWVCGTAIKGVGQYMSLPDLYDKVDSSIGLDVDNSLSTTSTNPVQNRVITNALNTKANTADLAQVAFSGNYTDLINKPVIPTKTSELTNDSGFISGLSSSDIINILGYTPYNATNPSHWEENKVATVKVNGTALTPTNKTVNISVPEKTSELRNDSGFLTEIDYTEVVDAIGYIPYDSANPLNYQENVIETIVANGTTLVPTNKTVSFTVGINATYNSVTESMTLS